MCTEKLLTIFFLFLGKRSPLITLYVPCPDPTLIHTDPPVWSHQGGVWPQKGHFWQFSPVFGHKMGQNDWIKKVSPWIKTFLSPMDQIHALVFTKWQLRILYRRLAGINTMWHEAQMFNMVIGWKHTLKRLFCIIFMVKKPCLKVQILQYKFLD